jgi:hypothetical protein
MLRAVGMRPAAQQAQPAGATRSAETAAGGAERPRALRRHPAWRFRRTPPALSAPRPRSSHSNGAPIEMKTEQRRRR